jgi:hypothetical protein
MEDNKRMEANSRFRDYTFNKMASEEYRNKNGSGIDVSTSRPLQHTKRWLGDNLLLIATICAVALGVILGEYAPRMVALGYSHRCKQNQ